MKNAPSFREADRPLSSRNLLNALVAAGALNGAACTNMPQPVAPSYPISSVSSSSPRPYSITGPLQTPDHLQTPNNLQKSAPQSTESEIPTGSQVIPITIYGRGPDVSTACVFTGEVLTHDRNSTPHTILLENMCLEKRGAMRNIFEGQHLLVEADSQGRYEIPFHDSYLREKEGRLVFVTKYNGTEVEGELGAGHERGSRSFERWLDAYGVRPIVK